MVRVFSTFTLSAWGSFHAVSALFYAMAVSDSGGLLVLSVLSGGLAPVLAVAHATLAGLCALVVVHLQSDREMDRAEALGLLALTGGLGATALTAASGFGAQAPGAYALFVAATLAGLTFDRRMALDEAEEVDEADHRAFLRLAADLGARERREPREGERR